MMAYNEFDLIQLFFNQETKSRKDVVLGIGDDAALLQVPFDQQLVVTTDTLVAARHFHTNTLPEDIGYKALAVNLSDLAAMGAEPAWILLALTLPSADESWLRQFIKGFFFLNATISIATCRRGFNSRTFNNNCSSIGLCSYWESTLPQGGSCRGSYLCDWKLR